MGKIRILGRNGPLPDVSGVGGGREGDFCEFDDLEVCAFPGFGFKDVAYLAGEDCFAGVFCAVFVEDAATFQHFGA